MIKPKIGPGLIRHRPINGEVWARLAEVAMGAEVEAYQQDDPEAKEALLRFAAKLFKAARGG